MIAIHVSIGQNFFLGFDTFHINDRIAIFICGALCLSLCADIEKSRRVPPICRYRDSLDTDEQMAQTYP